MNRAQTSDSLLPPRWILALLAVAGVLWLLFALKEIVAMLVLGYALAYVMDPVLSYLERRKLPRPLGFFLVCIIAILTILLLFFTALPTVVREYQSLVENFPDYVRRATERGGPILEHIRAYIPGAVGGEGSFGNPVELLGQIDGETINRLLAGAGATLLRGYSITLTILNFFLLPFIVFYLAVDLPRFHAWVLSLFPGRKRKRVASIAREIDEYISAFVRGQVTVGAVLFLLYCIGLAIVGVELWFLLAVIAGFGAIIPYMGFIIGIVLSSIMALATYGDFIHLVQVWVVFVVVQALEGTLITPRIVGDKVGISPLVVILAIVAGGQLFGLLGVFLAVPGAAVARVLLKHLHANLVTQ